MGHGSDHDLSIASAFYLYDLQALPLRLSLNVANQTSITVSDKTQEFYLVSEFHCLFLLLRHFMLASDSQFILVTVTG